MPQSSIRSGIVLPSSDIFPDFQYAGAMSAYQFTFTPSDFGLEDLGGAQPLTMSGNDPENLQTERMSQGVLFDGAMVDIVLKATTPSFELDQQNLLAILGANVRDFVVYFNGNITPSGSPAQIGGSDVTWGLYNKSSVTGPPVLSLPLDLDTYTYIDQSWCIEANTASVSDEFWWLWIRINATGGSFTQGGAFAYIGKLILGQFTPFTQDSTPAGGVNFWPLEWLTKQEVTGTRTRQVRTGYGNVWSYRLTPRRRCTFTLRGTPYSHEVWLQKLIQGQVYGAHKPCLWIYNLDQTYGKPNEETPRPVGMYARMVNDYETTIIGSSNEYALDDNYASDATIELEFEPLGHVEAATP